LSQADPAAKAFASMLEPLGWTLASIHLKLQTDGTSCGVWIQLVDQAFIEYVDSADYGDGSNFPEYLESWLAARDIKDLAKVASSERKAAVLDNEAAILGERRALRARLRTAAAAGRLEHLRDGARLEQYADAAAAKDEEWVDLTLDDDEEEGGEDGADMEVNA